MRHRPVAVKWLSCRMQKRKHFHQLLQIQLFPTALRKGTPAFSLLLCVFFSLFFSSFCTEDIHSQVHIVWLCGPCIFCCVLIFHVLFSGSDIFSFLCKCKNLLSVLKTVTELRRVYISILFASLHVLVYQYYPIPSIFMQVYLKWA